MTTVGSTPPSDNPAALYPLPSDALKAVSDRYRTWTAQLTQRSFELSMAVIAANWAVFGGINAILANNWAKWSMLLVMLGLLLTLLGTWWMAESLRDRLDYAEANAERWKTEHAKTKGKVNNWPFGDRVANLGKWLRGIKAILPAAAGVCFVVAVLSR